MEAIVDGGPPGYNGTRVQKDPVATTRSINHRQTRDLLFSANEKLTEENNAGEKKKRKGSRATNMYKNRIGDGGNVSTTLVVTQPGRPTGESHITQISITRQTRERSAKRSHSKGSLYIQYTKREGSS
jgi:hypothetical protein